ncbi:P-selectin-like [Hypanus sabinus]|uniref:P-selectin-like n=1 Tax=Hypanus sabinus TaxID=79690 RepID=UPI0028C45F2E|nr:P-selectin-like [Hypanus sabinus]XP_059840540.1 P-selectin-like [Hypanus sabinus]
MAKMVNQQTPQILRAGHRMQFVAIIILELLLLGEIHGWTYNYTIEDMSWKNARSFCQKKYTDMVAIQNAEEIEYLNNNIPKSRSYYWIGLRKINNVWTWVGTEKPLSKEAENWAKGEPNNSAKTGKEDCVEMYIQRDSDSGKWNDINCDKKKKPLCYTASCSKMSCSGKGECVETIGSYRCVCNDGFYGPECEHVVNCTNLEEQEQMTMTCLDPFAPFSYNSMCNFSCAEGFKLRGSETLECGASGEWSAPTPRCEAVQCVNLEEQEQLIMTCSDPVAPFSYNSTCNFRCAEGFELQGSETLECGASGEWSAPTPRCEAVQCVDLEEQEQLTMTCSDPFAPFSYNSTCNFSCAEGFKLRGSETLECGASGEWSAVTPQCEAVQCTKIGEQEQLIMTYLDPFAPFTYNSTCDFSCAEGFQLRGSERLVCGASGEWSAPTPHCEAIQCANLEKHEEMVLTCSDPFAPFSYNSTCNLRCAEGFKLRGSETLECGASGEWSAPTPRCEAVQCINLVEQEQLTMTCSNPFAPFSYNSMCNFRCAEGFKLRGSETLECGASGEWSAPTPRCEAVQCVNLEEQEQLTTTCSDPVAPFSYNSMCDFSCALGFELRGSKRLECGASGEWSAAIPQCEAVKCDVPEIPENGNMNCSHPKENLSYLSVCEFGCMKGFSLNGSVTLQCDGFGQWSAPIPVCEDSNPQPFPENYTPIVVASSMASGISALTFIIWLMRQLRRKAQGKKFSLLSNKAHKALGTYKVNEEV